MKKLVLLAFCAAAICTISACKKESSYTDCILNNIDKAQTGQAVAVINATCARSHPPKPFTFEEAVAGE